MHSHAKTKVDGSACLPDLGKRIRNWGVLKEGVPILANTSNTTRSDSIGVGGCRYELALVVNAQPRGCLLELTPLQADLLEQRKACNPVAQAFLVRSKRRHILGLEQEAIVDIPWRSLDLPLLVQNALMPNASGHRWGGSWRNMRAVRLARESPPPRAHQGALGIKL